MASIYEYSEPVSCNSALAWSNDFRLAFCTDSFIKILSWFFGQCLNQEPSNTETRIKMRQSFIPVEKDILDIPRYSAKEHIDLNKVLSRDEIFNIWPDKVMNPFKYPQDPLPVTAFCAAAWSPVGADEKGRCILATLSRDYRLMLFTQGLTEYKWNKIADLTLIRWEATQPSADYKTPSKFYEYRKWCHGQAITAICWCPLKFTDKADGRGYYLHAAGSMSGDVVFWKIKTPCLSISDCIVLSTNRDHSNKVTCMAWSKQSGLLAVSHYQGNLTVGIVNKDYGTVKWTTLDTSDDLMTVSCMCFGGTQQKDEEILIVNKEQYIYGYHIRLDEERNVSVLTTSFVHGLRQMYATGITKLDNESFIVSSMDCMLEVVKATVQSSDLQIEVSMLDECQTNEPLTRCNGVTVSPNSVFLSYVQRPLPGYERSSKDYRRPIKIIIKKLDHVTEESVYGTLLNHQGPLKEVTDSVECYRQYLVSNQHLSKDSDERTSRRDLQLKRFSLLCEISQTKSKSLLKMGREEYNYEDKCVDLNEQCLKVSYKLTGMYIEQCVGCMREKGPYNDSELHLLKRFFNFITRNNSIIDPEYANQLQSQIMDFLKGEVEPVQVYCPVCSCMVLKQFSWHCENGHQFGTCCHTLKPCTKMDYRRCAGCQAISLSLSDLQEWPWLPDVTVCVFCESDMF